MEDFAMKNGKSILLSGIGLMAISGITGLHTNNAKIKKWATIGLYIGIAITALGTILPLDPTKS